MVSIAKNLFWKVFTAIDARLKFPDLHKGETAVQLGFDMSAPRTSDLFLLHSRTGKRGFVIGIDPDPGNLEKAQEYIDKRGMHITLVQKAVFSHAGNAGLLRGEKAAWNQLDLLAPDPAVTFKNEVQTIETDTLDHILDTLGINVREISHINMTINGSEYYALLGMQQLLAHAENIGLTVIAGRHDPASVIDGEPDFEKILHLLQQAGFHTRFRRIYELFWWHWIVRRLIRGKKLRPEDDYGVIMAAKGKKRLRWYQSFS